MSQPSAVVRCPNCQRTNGAPSGGGRFTCMFCGAAIELPPPEAPASARAGPPPVEPFAAGGGDRLANAGPPPWTDDQPDSGGILAWERVYPWRETRGNLFGSLSSVLLGAGMLFYAIYSVRGMFAGANSALEWLLLLMVGVAFAVMIFSGLAGLFNTSRLRLSGGWLQVHTAPLPWPRTRSLPVSEIRSLEITTHVVKSRNYFRLSVRQANGKRLTLLDQFNRPDLLEQAVVELRQALGLVESDARGKQ